MQWNENNQGMLKYYEFLLNPECERWLRNVFVYNISEKEKELALITKDMGMDYICLNILIIICKEYLKNCQRENLNALYIINYGSCYLKIKEIKDLELKEIKYQVNTCPKSDLDKDIVSIDHLKTVAVYYANIMKNVDILIKKGIRIEDILEYLNECFNKEKSVKSK